MNTGDFENHLRDGEGLTVEFKRCGNQPEKDTFETICSFANRQGGVIFLGVEDDGQVTGVLEHAVSDIERNIVNIVSNPDCFNVAPTFEFEEISYEEKTVLRVWIPMGPTVYRYKGRIYDRIADVDVRVTSDTQISALYLRKSAQYSERKVYKYFEREDIRTDLIDRARKMALARTPKHPWGEMSDNELLRSSSLYLRDRETGEEGYTLAAALLLGTDEVIADLCPSYVTDAIVRKENLDRYDDRLLVKTNLIEAYDLLFYFAQKNLPDRFHLENGHSVSARDIIIREVVSNLLAHREYLSLYPAKLVIDNDTLRTENASRSIFEGRLTLNDFNPMPKNPVIADFFAQIGRADKLGSGMHNLVKYTEIYADGSPELVEGDFFKTSIPIRKNVLAEAKISLMPYDPNTIHSIADAIEAMLNGLGYATPAEIAKMSGLSSKTAKRHLAAMMEQGILVAEGTTRDRKYRRK
ncbi:MAG: putative DNA binding domain-containing protein [Gordonibacter sp.]|uniref:RNA-binding domain-containing protein n=1 Tax=Gordonibacter sp. TaxID=1968902 RepID=UPI002FCACFF0